MMNINYNILFTIELLHEYFLNGKARNLEIIPANDCVEINRRMNIQLRNNENRWIAFIRENDLQEPFINSDKDKVYRQFYEKTVFRFYLKIKDPLFLNYTNIELTSVDNMKFYFSNLAANPDNGVLYLSTPVPEFTIGTDYVPGNLVKDPANGNVFESLKKNTAKKKTQLTEAGLWAPKGLLNLSKPLEDHVANKTYQQGDLVKELDTDNVFEATKKHSSINANKDLVDKKLNLWIPRGQGQLQYPTSNDMTECCGNNYLFVLPAPVKTADISIFAFNYNAAKPAFTEEILPEDPEFKKRKFGTPVGQVNINLSKLNLKPGKYKIQVNKESRILYYDPKLTSGEILGVIEIFNHLPGKDEYALLTNEEKIKTTAYQIHFPNRRVLWKYTRKDGKAKSITDTGKTKYEFKLLGEDFVSATPIPLAENSLRTLKLEFNTKDFDLQPLPNPRIQRLGKFKQGEKDEKDPFEYFCSEIFLNY
ncbi:MAG: hypothetical protein ABIQ31_06410 [Ferruginibacter sp.]